MHARLSSRSSPDRAGSVAGIGHIAMFYRGDADYVDGVASFIRDGLAAQLPVLVAVPPAALDRLRSALAGERGDLSFTDMSELGRNPARIIPAFRQFTDRHPGGSAFVGEPIWAGRTAAEVAEATRHEDLINAAFADVRATILCPYDAGSLDRRVLEDAEATHPMILAGRAGRPSPCYRSGAVAAEIAARRPWPPPACAAVLEFDSRRLPTVRELTRAECSAAGLTGIRVLDAVIAVNEAASNTITHAGSHGTLSIWRERGELVCDVTDTGHIADPLAGRRPAPPGAPGGHGLRLISEVCDLVEVRSGAWGTSVRMHLKTG
jgi:anti-sigma regulatory factor (Ser/Thr protein kinase)